MDLNVCLMGGGTRLASHLGALRGIEDKGGRVVAWSGASAGSILAAILAAGYSHHDAVDLLMRTDFRRFLDFRPFGILRGFGICSGKALEDWLESVLKGRRFKDLKTPLSVICTNIQTGQPIAFSKQSAPDVLVSAAVRCSVSIPGVFAIRRINGAVLVDGSLVGVESVPLFPDDDFPSLTIRLVRNRPPTPKPAGRLGLAAYVQRIAAMLLDAADDTRLNPQGWKHTLLIQTGHHSSINFDLTEEEKQALYQMGFEQCHQFLDLKDLARPGQVTAHEPLAESHAAAAES